jgi:hypothetical protein
MPIGGKCCERNGGKNVTPEREMIPALMEKLTELVARANESQRQRIYTMEYYGGKWVRIRYKGFAEFEFTDVIDRDTQVDVGNILSAIETMEAELKLLGCPGQEEAIQMPLHCYASLLEERDKLARQLDRAVESFVNGAEDRVW